MLSTIVGYAGAVLVIALALLVLRLLFLKFPNLPKHTLEEYYSIAEKAVAAVEQTFKTKPDDMSQEEWNARRKTAAIQAFKEFAALAGITIPDDVYASIYNLIEAAVAKLPKSLGVLKAGNLVSAPIQGLTRTVNQERATMDLPPVPWGNVPLQELRTGTPSTTKPPPEVPSIDKEE